MERIESLLHPTRRFFVCPLQSAPHRIEHWSPAESEGPLFLPGQSFMPAHQVLGAGQGERLSSVRCQLLQPVFDLGRHVSKVRDAALLELLPCQVALCSKLPLTAASGYVPHPTN